MPSADARFECVGGPLDGDTTECVRVFKRKFRDGAYELSKFTSPRTKNSETVLRWVPGD
jgi:hypothetical protein